jgi:predicted kinase
MLIVFGGRPGSGKTTLSRTLAQELHAAWLRVDLIEAATWRAGVARDQPTGLAAYVVAFALAEVHLDMGTPTVIDAVNPVEAARQGWRELAATKGLAARVIEVVCSDEALHRSRLDGRTRGIPGWYELTWDDVQRSRRKYEPWTDEHLVLDAVDPASQNLDAALAYIADRR